MSDYDFPNKGLNSYVTHVYTGTEACLFLKNLQKVSTDDVRKNRKMTFSTFQALLDAHLISLLSTVVPVICIYIVEAISDKNIFLFSTNHFISVKE